MDGDLYRRLIRDQHRAAQHANNEVTLILVARSGTLASTEPTSFNQASSSCTALFPSVWPSPILSISSTHSTLPVRISYHIPFSPFGYGNRSKSA